MNPSFYTRLDKAHESIKSMISHTPEIGIILGSGLSTYAETLGGDTIPYEKIEGFPLPTVKGHRGFLHITPRAAICAGRFHYYEGHPPETVVLPVFLLFKLGIKALILTNAAGGLNPGFRAGDLVLIKDHINLMGMNPLRGPNNPGYGPRFPDMSGVYDNEYSRYAKEQDSVPLQEGVYAAMAGPSYETPAEIRMLRTLGADMVGMSTVPEAIAARYLGLQVVGISCITNMAAGIAEKKIDHKEVIETGSRVIPRFSRLLNYLIDY
jgi:purine-nucleoside phosphorylase